MKNFTHIFGIMSVVLYPSALHAQQDTVFSEAPMAQRIDAIAKKSDKLNLYFNMQGDLSAEESGSEFTGAKFQMRQFRIEAKGNINDWLSYRFRQQFTGSNGQLSGFDNMWLSVDNAYLGVRLGKWQMIFGKQCAAFGGYEFDCNPIDIYEASDINGAGISYVTGAQIGYNFNYQQQLCLQIVNSNPLPVRDMYGDWTPAKMPMMYTLNWNGAFAPCYRTRWSASFMEQVQGKQLYYLALGNELSLGRFGAYFDWMYAKEGVDLRGIVTGIVGGDNPARHTTDTQYMSYLLHLNYRIAPRWNVIAKLMIENEGIYSTHTAERNGADVTIDKGNYRTAYGYIGGIEYYPMDDSSLHFFAIYVGRNYRYTSLAKAYGADDYSTNRISVGFVWRMPVF